MHSINICEIKHLEWKMLNTVMAHGRVGEISGLHSFSWTENHKSFSSELIRNHALFQTRRFWPKLAWRCTEHPASDFVHLSSSCLNSMLWAHTRTCTRHETCSPMLLRGGQACTAFEGYALSSLLAYLLKMTVSNPGNNTTGSLN